MPWRIEGTSSVASAVWGLDTASPSSGARMESQSYSPEVRTQGGWG